jgi:hypothetical protein
LIPGIHYLVFRDAESELISFHIRGVRVFRAISALTNLSILMRGPNTLFISTHDFLSVIDHVGKKPNSEGDPFHYLRVRGSSDFLRIPSSLSEFLETKVSER